MHQPRLVFAVFVLLLFAASSCAPSAAAPPIVSTTPATAGSSTTATTPAFTPAIVSATNTPALAVSTTTPEPTLTPTRTQAPAGVATAPALSGTAQQQVIVDMKNYAFVPKSITVAPGTTVVWRNDDATTHTVTADNKLFDSGDMSQGAQFKYVFTKAGEYPYYCIWHGGPGGQGMSGTVTVK